MGVTPCSVPILQTVFEVTGTYELPRQKPLLNRCVPLIPLESSNQEDQLWPLLPQAKPILARRRGPNSTTFGHHPFTADVAGLTGRKFRWRSIERLAYSAASRKRKPYSCCAPNLKSLFPKQVRPQNRKIARSVRRCSPAPGRLPVQKRMKMGRSHRGLFIARNAASTWLSRI